MTITNKEGADRNPYRAFTILLAELEAEGFFAQSGIPRLDKHRACPWLQCHFID
jgi:hypothetical protein